MTWESSVGNCLGTQFLVGESSASAKADVAIAPLLNFTQTKIDSWICASSSSNSINLCSRVKNSTPYYMFVKVSWLMIRIYFIQILGAS